MPTRLYHLYQPANNIVIMATFQQWNYPAPEAPYNPAASANVSSYFVRPNKVVKPSSRNGSPRNLGRRKTTTGAFTSSRTRSAVDHLRSAAQWQNPELARSRPVSWHPDYFEVSNFSLSPPVGGEIPFWGFSTAQVNGLITPVSYPSMNEPQIQEFSTPLDELPAQDPALSYESQHYHQQSWLNQGQMEIESYSYPRHSNQPSMQPGWQLNQIASIPNVQTAPSSPDCPPVQNIRLDTLSLGTNDRKLPGGPEELVGMGLYDSPAEVQSCSLLFGENTGCARKGLKLEESFEPTEQEDDEDGEEEEEVDGSEEDQQDVRREEVDQKWQMSTATDYDSQSIASHLTYGIEPRPEPLASTYLATLRQMNSAYYPSDYLGYGQGYGWI